MTAAKIAATIVDVTPTATIIATTEATASATEATMLSASRRVAVTTTSDVR